VVGRQFVNWACAANAFRGTLALAVLMTVAIEPGPARADDPWEPLRAARLTATGRVLLPDGSRAANVIVAVIDGDQPDERVRTDAQGRFQIRDLFGYSVWLHAHTPDWRLQACLAMSAGHARLALRKPVELKLAPAREQQVLVKSLGRPVGGIKLLALGSSFRAHATSGVDGRASLWIPTGHDWRDIYAWDPKLVARKIAATFRRTRRALSTSRCSLRGRTPCAWLTKAGTPCATWSFR
jgi:hypothetical protein